MSLYLTQIGYPLLVRFLLSVLQRIFFLLALKPIVGLYFHSPVAGFSLLAYEVS